MSNDELKNMIELYYDGELEKESEPLLLTILSRDVEARNYFKQLFLFRSVIKDSAVRFPAELESTFLHSIKTEVPKLKKNLTFRDVTFRIVSIAASVILLVICSYFFHELQDSKSKLESVTEQLTEQKENMDIFIHNRLSSIVVKPESKYEIVIRANSRRKI